MTLSVSLPRYIRDILSRLVFVMLYVEVNVDTNDQISTNLRKGGEENTIVDNFKKNMKSKMHLGETYY
jgi:hypothetical protein